MKNILKNLKVIKLNNKNIYTKDKPNDNKLKKKLKIEIKELQLS